jgi:hypothetical protein
LHPRGKPKIYILQGGNPKEFFAEGKAKMVYFTWGKDLFTLWFMNGAKLELFHFLLHGPAANSEGTIYTYR